MARTKTPNEGYEGDWGLEPQVNIDPTLLEASVDGQGGTIRNKPVFTAEQVAFQLNRGDGLITEGGVTYETGAQWFGGKGPANNDYYTNSTSKVDSDGTLDTLSFGFYETKETLPAPYIYTRASDGTDQTYVGFGVANGFSAFSEAQRAATREAIASWDDLIAVDFIETPFQQGDINFMNTTTGPAQASAYLPYDYGSTGIIQDDGSEVTYAEISGDVFVATPSKNASNGRLDEGEYGLTTLIHELGHSLGLEHPGNYNFGPGFAVNYTNGAEYYQDSNQYSIMSYWGGQETGAAYVDWNKLQFVYASTPGVHDILAVQRIYGADMTTRTGDTTYGFNSNADRDAYDFVKTPLPIVTIWDAGGTDKLDVSGFATNSTINLNPGSFSSAGGSGVVPLADLKARGILPASYTEAQYTALRARYNSPDGLLHDNISIAYGATIENATTGAGDDLIIANNVANVMDGGAGNDTVSYVASDKSVFVTLDNVPATGLLGHLQGLLPDGLGGYAQGDRLLNIENVTGSNFNDQLLGNNVANTLTGLDGDDILWANGGDDTLLGGNGNDVLIGGDGLDSLLGGAGNDLLNGGDGDDVLNGGAGDDTMSGGKGNDIFVISDLGGADELTDFQHGKDKIDLSDIDAIAGNTGHDAFTFIGKDAFSNTAGELRTYKEGGDFFLAGDVNGDGIADFTVEINNSSLKATDIIFV